MGLFIRLTFFVIYTLTLISMFFSYAILMLLVSVNPFKKSVYSGVARVWLGVAIATPSYEVTTPHLQSRVVIPNNAHRARSVAMQQSSLRSCKIALHHRKTIISFTSQY